MLSKEADLKLRAPSSAEGLWSSGAFAARLSSNPPALSFAQDGQTILNFAPYAPDGQLAGLAFSGPFTHLLGLGANAFSSGETLNLVGQTIMPATPFGNGRLPYLDFQSNGVQVPLVYALGEGKSCCAIFVDETRPLMWNFKGQPWTVSPAGPLGPKDSLRFFLITGPDLPSVRRQFMELSGRPPVPPQKALGVWVSGLKKSNGSDWSGVISSLAQSVPGLSGLLGAPASAAEALWEACQTYNLRFMLDESAYVPQSSPLFSEMARRSYLVRQGGPESQALRINRQGEASGLVDYTNPAAQTFWHSLFREQLINSGFNSFRLVDDDLSDFSSLAWYEGDSEAASHSHYAWANVFALKWLDGLQAGYQTQRMRNRPRLMLLSRGGTAGLQARGGMLYSDDSFIFGHLSRQAAKAHLALSGIDYSSSDLSLSLSRRPADQFGSLYDTIVAQNALVELPLIVPHELLSRPAVSYNLGLRHSLSPYIYCLAWQAYLFGNPILAPLAYYYQDDPAARQTAAELMLGPSLLVGLDLDDSAERGSVYVPAGSWYNWRSGEMIQQPQGAVVQLDTKEAGLVTAPILAKSGSIIPTLTKMTDAAGKESVIPTLKIFLGPEPAEFIWYEDDGESHSYLNGRFGRTLITAVTDSNGSTVVTIKAREGSWDGAPAARQIIFDLYGPQAPGEATLDNLPYNRLGRAEGLERADAGWASFGNNRIRFKTPPLEVDKDHVLSFK